MFISEEPLKFTCTKLILPCVYICDNTNMVLFIPLLIVNEINTMSVDSVLSLYRDQGNQFTPQFLQCGVSLLPPSVQNHKLYISSSEF